MARRSTSPQIIRYTAGDIRVLISSDDTAGAMSMIETVSAPGRGPTWHCHSREDEFFYVIYGVAEVRVGEEIYRCEAGDRVVGPRNIFHTYRNIVDTDLKMILEYTPGGFEHAFADATEMLAKGKDQTDVGRMLTEHYGLTRGQMPS